MCLSPPLLANLPLDLTGFDAWKRAPEQEAQTESRSETTRSLQGETGAFPERPALASLSVSSAQSCSQQTDQCSFFPSTSHRVLLSVSSQIKTTHNPSAPDHAKEKIHQALLQAWGLVYAALVGHNRRLALAGTALSWATTEKSVREEGTTRDAVRALPCQTSPCVATSAGCCMGDQDLPLHVLAVSGSEPSDHQAVTHLQASRDAGSFLLRSGRPRRVRQRVSLPGRVACPTQVLSPMLSVASRGKWRREGVGSSLGQSDLQGVMLQGSCQGLRSGGSRVQSSSRGRLRSHRHSREH